MAARFDLDALGWRVLLLGGPSGVGKSTVAMLLGQQLGIPWLMVDDFRLAFERSGFAIPDADAVPTFDGTGGLLTHGELLTPAIEVVIENHVDQHAPAIFEGDAILPSIMERSSVRQRVEQSWLRIVFLYESEEQIIHSNMRARGRTLSDAAHARKNWLYGEWLRREAETRGIPTLPARPWDTLAERVLAAASVPLIPHSPGAPS